MVSFVKKSHSSKRMNWILFIIFVLTSVILIIFNVELVLVNSSSTVKRDHDINNRVCGDDNSVSVYLLKTKLGVSYQGSHWFHVAENFMAYHSALRAQNRQTCSPRVLYLFDKDKFTEELNGMTKMMIALGSLADLTSPPCLQQQRSAQVTSQSIYFGRLHSDWTTMGLKPGRTVSIPQSIFSELTVIQTCLKY